jgi:hypothetical protein
MHAELVQQFPWLNDADVITVDTLAEAVSTHQRLTRYIDDVISGRERAYPRRGAPRTGVEAIPERIWVALERSRKAVLDASGKLAMNPIERAGLAKALGDVFGRAAAGPVLGEQGRQLRQARGRLREDDPPGEDNSAE